MSFEKISELAQIIASVGVIASLIFVALQIRQNTGALQRSEHNSTMRSHFDSLSLLDLVR